jgi:hypothetical protein
MSIQSTINQGLSLAGLLISQSPAAEARKAAAAEKGKADYLNKQLRKSAEVSNTALDVATDLWDKSATGTAADVAEDLFVSSLESELDTTKELFKADPTKETGQMVINKETALREHKEEMSTRKAEEAERKAQDALKAEQKRLARSRILEGVYTTDPTYDPVEKIRQGGKKNG